MDVYRFKTIKRDDLDRLKKHYLNFEPYSDFNVVSMWGYMVPGAKYMQLGDAIAYELNDYNKSTKYHTLLGNKDAIKLAEVLAKKNNGHLKLSCVPQHTVKMLSSWEALTDVNEDIDNHDYVFATDEIANLATVGSKEKKKSLRKLLAKHPNLKSMVIVHSDQKNRNKIYRLFRKWAAENDAMNWDREFKALKRELKIPGYKIVVIGAYDKNKLIGFTVNEIEENGYYQGHFGKASYKYPSLGLFLEVETAKIIKEKFGCKYMNLQQDMGIEGIRYYKQSLQPLFKLKKYNIAIDLPSVSSH